MSGNKHGMLLQLDPNPNVIVGCGLFRRPLFEGFSSDKVGRSLNGTTPMAFAALLTGQRATKSPLPVKRASPPLPPSHNERLLGS